MAWHLRRLLSVALVLLVAGIVLVSPSAHAQAGAPAVTFATYDESQGYVILGFALDAGWNYAGTDMAKGASPPALSNNPAWSSITQPYTVSSSATRATLHVTVTPGETYWFRLNERAQSPSSSYLSSNPCHGTVSDVPYICYAPAFKFVVPAPAAPPVAPPPAAPTQPPSASAGAPPVPATGSLDVPVHLPPPPAVGPPRDVNPPTGGIRPTLPVNAEACSVSSVAEWQGNAARAKQLGRTDLEAQANGCAALQAKVKAEQAKQGQAQKPETAPAKGELAVRGTLDKAGAGVIREGEAKESPATAGGAIGPGDTVVTKGEGATVALEGGSRIDAGPNARFTLADGSEASVAQQKGRLFYDIKSRVFRVKVDTPRGRYFIAVHGTQFTVDVADDGSGTVQVAEGTVEVTSAEKTVEVRAGSSLTVRPGQAPSAPAAASSAAGRGASTLPIALAAVAIALLAVGGVTIATRGRRTRS